MYNFTIAGRHLRDNLFSFMQSMAEVLSHAHSLSPRIHDIAKCCYYVVSRALELMAAGQYPAPLSSDKALILGAKDAGAVWEIPVTHPDSTTEKGVGMENPMLFEAKYIYIYFFN